MQKTYNKYGRYIIFGIGFLATILLTAGIIVLNKEVFNAAEFKAMENATSIKNAVNNLLGFSEGIVVFGTFILYLLESGKDNKEEK